MAEACTQPEHMVCNAALLTDRLHASPAPALPQKECNVPGKACYQVWRTNFEIDEQYQPIKAIGKGAYGVVCSAKHAGTGEKVAIKKITNAFENLIDARRTLREMKLLRYLRWAVAWVGRHAGRGWCGWGAMKGGAASKATCLCRCGWTSDICMVWVWADGCVCVDGWVGGGTA